MKRFSLVLAAATAAMWIWAGGGDAQGRPPRPKASSAPASGATTVRSPATATAPASGPAHPKERVSGGRKAHADAPTIAYMRMTSEVLESPPSFVLFSDDSMTLQGWLQRLAKARNDKSISAVAIDIDGPGVSRAHAQELADAVARLNAVKPVYVFLNSPGSSDHLIASAAKEVFMDPADTLTILGVGLEMLYFRGTLDKLGITPQFVQVGSYKGASESLSLTEPSKEVKEMYGWVLDDLYDQLLSQLRQHRRIPLEKAAAAVDAGILTPAEAKKVGLIDELVAREDWLEKVEDRVAPHGKDVFWEDDYGEKVGKKIDLSNPFSLLGNLMKGKKQDEIKSPTIAVVHADGVITIDGDDDDLFGEGGVSARRLAKIFRDLEDNDHVKAVLFRIDSPGGSALASEQIHEAVRHCAEVKPVIVSIASMGASGGYYIATAGTTILADPGAIVGSIGVISGKIALTGLFEKIGVSRFEMTRGASAGLEMMRPWTDKEQALIASHAQTTYDLFLTRVKEGRGRKIARIDDVAQGRIFTARQARDKGLIDQIGGFRDAVLKAQQLAGIKEAHFITLPRTRTLLDLLSGGEQSLAPKVLAGRLGLDAAVSTLLKMAGPTEKKAACYFLRMTRLLAREKTLCAMPGYLDIRW